KTLEQPRKDRNLPCSRTSKRQRVASPMGISSEEAEDRRMQGWLYLVRSNRLGLQYSRKRYFVLDGNALNCYKNVPASNREVVYVFTLCSASNHKDQLKVSKPAVGCQKLGRSSKMDQIYNGRSIKGFNAFFYLIHIP
ncbi:hypothetical protein BHE74_00038792, partial [Ensete ventricosum]